MEIYNNFASIICLGYFNPSILTPDFITNVCNLKFEGPAQGQTTPVVSSIQWGNILFLVEMDKMRIQENNIKDFKDTQVNKYFNSYLSILRYTPVFTCGFNLNSKVSEFDINNINNNIQDKHMSQILNTNSLTIDKKEIVKGDERQWESLNFTFPAKDNTLFRLNLRRSGEEIILNLNYEIKGIDKDPKAIRKLDEQFPFIIDFNQKITEFITRSNKWQHASLQ